MKKEGAHMREEGWGLHPPGWGESLGGRRRIRGDGTVANQIRQWNDLADPGIDPFEYPRELPQHFSDVEKLLTDESAMFEDAADTAKRNAATFGDYVEYLNTAEVAAGVISPILDAAEEIHNWVAAIRQASESMSRAAEFVKAAQRAAEGEYGDWDVPRFDKSN